MARVKMHELGITQGIVEIAEGYARQEGAQQVVSVTVAIGELSGVVPDAVEFCFEACTRGTALEGARLIIERIAGRGLCHGCDAEVPLDVHTFACPECGAFGLERVQGEELRIIEMEVD